MNNSKPEDVEIVTSKLLSVFPDIRCGISMRKGGVSPLPYDMNLSFNVGDDPANVQENRKRFFKTLKIDSDKLAIPRQVHSDIIRKVCNPGIIESCDALVTQEVGLFLSITIADCLPIFLYDPVTPSIGAVHSGWKGSKLRILEKTIRTMMNEFGTESRDIIAYLGPAADACCYEVGEDVAHEFEEQYLIRRSGRQSHLNMKRLNKDILLAAGVKEEYIEVSEYCTICNSRIFHSFRRNKERSGRMMAVIGLLG